MGAIFKVLFSANYSEHRNKSRPIEQFPVVHDCSMFFNHVAQLLKGVLKVLTNICLAQQDLA